MVATPTIWLPARKANTSDTGPGGNSQFEPKLVQLASGNFLVLYTSNTDSGAGLGTGSDILGQLYDADGTKLGQEFRASKVYENAREADGAAMPDGGFAVVFHYRDTNLNQDFVAFTRWGSDLTSPGSAIPFGNPAYADIGSSTVSVNNDGRFWLAAHYTGPSGATVLGKLVNPAQLSTTTIFSGDPDVGNNGQQLDSARLANNNTVFVVGSNRPDEALGYRIMNASGGNVKGAAFVAETGENGELDEAPSIAGLTGGGFVIAWTNDDIDTDIHFQRYAANGNELGEQDFVGSGGETDDNRTPAVVGLADGGFFIAWDDNEGRAIAGQRFNANGVEVGEEVTITSDSQLVSSSEPALALLQDGRIAVAWSSRSLFQIGSPDIDVFSAILDPRGNLLSYGAAAQQLTTRREDTTVNAGGGNDTVYGQAGDDQISGQAGDDRLTASHGGDTLNGGGGNDTLNGGTHEDQVLGATGNDVVNGGLHRDTLNGGAGFDIYLFDATLGAAADADLVQSFAVADDTIQLDNAIFTALPAGTLAAGVFKIGPATDANDRIIYAPGSGGLFYDTDGTGAAAAIRFATMPANLALTNLDFVVV